MKLKDFPYGAAFGIFKAQRTAGAMFFVEAGERFVRRPIRGRSRPGQVRCVSINRPSYLGDVWLPETFDVEVDA